MYALLFSILFSTNHCMFSVNTLKCIRCLKMNKGGEIIFVIIILSDKKIAMAHRMERQSPINICI